MKSSNHILERSAPPYMVQAASSPSQRSASIYPDLSAAVWYMRQSENCKPRPSTPYFDATRTYSHTFTPKNQHTYKTHTIHASVRRRGAYNHTYTNTAPVWRRFHMPALCECMCDVPQHNGSAPLRACDARLQTRVNACTIYDAAHSPAYSTYTRLMLDGSQCIVELGNICVWENYTVSFAARRAHSCTSDHTYTTLCAHGTAGGCAPTRAALSTRLCSRLYSKYFGKYMYSLDVCACAPIPKSCIFIYTIHAYLIWICLYIGEERTLRNLNAMVICMWLCSGVRLPRVRRAHTVSDYTTQSSYLGRKSSNIPQFCFCLETVYYMHYSVSIC